MIKKRIKLIIGIVVFLMIVGVVAVFVIVGSAYFRLFFFGLNGF